MKKSLQGAVALVAGATRGAGRAIAPELAAARATVYATRRSTKTARSPMNRRETIEETVEWIAARGGNAAPVRVDHTVPEEVVALSPGFLRSEAMLDHFGVTETTLRDAIAKNAARLGQLRAKSSGY